jgi:hypothetical protein
METGHASKIVIRFITVFIILSGFCSGAWASENRAMDEAIKKAAQQIADDLSKTNFEDIKNIAILPLWGYDEDSYVTDTLKSYLSKGKYPLFVRASSEWDMLLGEMKWNTLREDIMNSQTVQKFGKIEGCNAILYGTVREKEINNWTFHAIVRMTVHLSRVETGQLKWSSAPVTASVWLEWPDILRLAVRNPLVWIVAGLIVLLVFLRTLTRFFTILVRPR